MADKEKKEAVSEAKPEQPSYGKSTLAAGTPFIVDMANVKPKQKIVRLDRAAEAAEEKKEEAPVQMRANPNANVHPGMMVNAMDPMMPMYMKDPMSIPLKSYVKGSKAAALFNQLMTSVCPNSSHILCEISALD